MVNKFLGSKLYLKRNEYSKAFDSKQFIKFANENKVLKELLVKYKKYGTDNSVKSQEVVNKILEIYDNIFILMMGGEVEESFAERQQKAKDMVKTLNKDKSLTKLTGSQNCYIIEQVMADYLNEGKELKFKCVVHPIDSTSSYRNFNGDTSYGIREDITFLRMVQKNLGGSEMEFGVKSDDNKGVIRHNYADWRSYGKKYTKLDFGGIPYVQYKIDLFVQIPKSEIPTK